MSELVETFQTLLRSEGSLHHDDEMANLSMSVEDRQCQLCQELTGHLLVHLNNHQQSSPQHAAATTSSNVLTIRQVFDNAPSSQLSTLATPLLSNLLTHRVDREALLPMTQDSIANEEALDSSMAAITITRPAMVAAELYSTLLSMPGAVGYGLVKLEPLTALSALIRRWSVECCGREGQLMQDDGQNSGKRNSFCSRTADSPTKSPPKKISRRRGPRRVVIVEDSMDDDEESDESSLPPDNSPHNTLRCGYQIAETLCKVVRQREFPSWSSEAREALLDALLSSFATCAALKDHPSASPQTKSLLTSVVSRTKESLQQCLDQLPTKPLRHATAVIVLRGLFPVLSFKENLPNGERGKQAAHSAASDTVESMILGVSESLRQANASSFQTPRRSRNRRKSAGATMTNQGSTNLSKIFSPRSLRKKRVSFDGRTPSMTTPAVKGRHSTANSLSTPSTVPSNLQPRPVLTAFLGMLQKLSTSDGLERASVRAPTIQTLHNCLQSLPQLERSHFLRYLLKLCRSKISIHRLVGCELIGKVLEQDWVWTDHSRDPATVWGDNPGVVGSATPISEETALTPGTALDPNVVLPVALWRALQGRLVDRISSVRARAAFSIESALVHGNGDIRATVDESSLVALRTRAVKDEAATVRKAAIGAMSQLLKAQPEWLSERYIASLGELTHDPSSLTRKAAAEGLTLLLEEWVIQDGNVLAEGDDDRLQWLKSLLEEAWATCVLPLVLDDETGCTSKALSLFERILVNPILGDRNQNGGKNPLDDEPQKREQAAWRLLAVVGIRSGQQGASKGEVDALQAALRQVARENWSRINVHLLERMVRVAYRALPTDDANRITDDSPNHAQECENREAQLVGVWCLFHALIAGQLNDLDAIAETIQDSNEGLEFICTSWESMLERMCQDPSGVSVLKGTMRSCLMVVANLASGLSPEAALQCATNLKRALLLFSLPPAVIGAAIDALAALVGASLDDPTPDRVRRECLAWIQESFQTCEQKITDIVQESCDDAEAGLTSVRQTDLSRALFTVGSLTMVGFRADDDNDIKNDSDKDKGEASSNSTPDILRRLNQRPSKRLQDIVKALLSDQLPGSATVATPASVRAHAFTVLGKLCLRDESLAKECLNLLARELHPSRLNNNNTSNISSAAIQSNALLVLGDLCVRYTNMVDRYLPVMAACLQAGCSNPSTNILNPSDSDTAIVRKHAVLLLSSLLLQDYIKWRGLLFHRFLVASSDEDEGVAQLAETVLCGPLCLRQPKLFFNNFVESIFVLNRCTAHPIYVAAATMGDGGSGIAVGFEGIHLQGAVGEVRRRRMYLLMCSKLSDEEKIGVTARLAKEVLGSALDSQSDLGRVCRSSAADGSVQKNDAYESAWNVLTDAFFVLKSKALKVGSKAHHQGDVELDDPGVMANPARQVSAAKTRLLSKISSKHLVEAILPILSNLKTVLEASCSPLLKDLMTYVVTIYKNYKTEVQEFLANDPTLLQEIEYDARQQTSGGRNPGANSFPPEQERAE